MRSIGCFTDRLQQPFQHVQANHPEIILCDNGLSENHLCEIITFTKKSRLYIIVCDHIHRSQYIVYTIYIHIYLCLRITMKIFRDFIKFCLQKNNASSLHLTPRSPKKVGTLKGPKESSADSELLNFSLASVAFFIEGIYVSTLPGPSCMLWVPNAETYELLQDFFLFSLSIMTLLTAFVGHVFTPGLRGSDLSCCKSQLVLALLGQWPSLQTLHLRLPVKSTCSNALYITYLTV